MFRLGLKFFLKKRKNYELFVVSLRRNVLERYPYMLQLFLRRYPFAILVAVVIVLLSLLPMPDLKVGVQVPLADKWTHMVMYGALTLAVWFDYKRSHRQLSAGKLLLFAFFAPIVMGGVLELMQAYLTTCRSGEWLDFVANTIGVCCGNVGGLMIKKVKR